MRLISLATVSALLLVVSACSSGPTAPDVEPIGRVCNQAFCIDVPAGWGEEVGDTHIAFHHELAVDDTFLTASVVDMEAIVTAAGGTWPVPPDEVVEAFWALLDDVDEGSLIRTERQVGGAIRSWGHHSTGDMWHVLVPVDGSMAIAVELRGPNTSWESHADVVFQSVEPVG